jgi:hypothetical protein
VLQYAAGHDATEGEQGEIADLARQFRASGLKPRALLVAVAASPAFRYFTQAD